MDELAWFIVVLIAIAIVFAFAYISWARRRRPFSTQPLPERFLPGYESRLPELERMFVTEPRESVAAARLLVDDMLTRMGYPARLTNEERAKDLAFRSRTHADRYRTATRLKNDPGTEDLRRALTAHLDTARDLIADARKRHGPTRLPEPEPEGKPQVE